MKTTKTMVYALACIQELSREVRKTRQVSDIAEARNIPGAYCQKVLFLLAKAGILSSVKGRGFSLLDSPENISALRVFEAMGESPAQKWADESGFMGRLEKNFSAKLSESLGGLKVSELFVQAQ